MCLVGCNVCGYVCASLHILKKTKVNGFALIEGFIDVKWKNTVHIKAPSQMAP